MRIVATVVVIIVWLLCVAIASFALGFTAGRQSHAATAAKSGAVVCKNLLLL